MRELRERGVPAAVVDDAALVMSELVGNAVRHGQPLPGDYVRTSWWVDDGTVHLEVCDGGPGFGAVLRPVAATAEGGRGLPIVDTLASSWGTTAPDPSGGVGVFAELPLPGARRAPHLFQGGAERLATWAGRTTLGGVGLPA